MRKYLVFLALAMVVAACGGSESSDPPDTTAGASPTTVGASPEGTQPPTTEAESSDTPPAAGQPGGIVLTIGDETWEFGSAQCAFYNASPGSDGSEWNVSNIKDGLQVYVNVDPFETSVTIADIANGGSPTLSWEAVDDAVSLTVDGDSISAQGTFTDNVGGSGPTEGTLEAECADWFEG
ncbi:MAG: hypothetical protein HKO63_01100 [Acidimicrobiia bacterium]|nr:hypothetical protein [Acidimicrobiia bacterium]